MIKFEAEGHKYYWNGQRVPSVSDILNIIFGEFDSHGKDDKAGLGTNVHLCLKLLDENKLDFDTLDKAYLPYIQAWEDFKSDTISHKGTDEEPFKGLSGIVDIKTGVEKIRDHYQLLMYRELIPDNQESDLIEQPLYSIKYGYAGTPDRIYLPLRETPFRDYQAVYLSDGGTYKPVKMKKKLNWNVVLSALQIIKTRKENGLWPEN